MKVRSIAGATAAVALVTAASRLVGFGRVAVLARALGTSCVGDTYQAANSVPNVVFEVVAGGALASVVVPVLAGVITAGDRDSLNRIASALLTWTVLVLTPVSAVGMLLAPQLMRALVGSDPRCGRPMLEVGSRMLVVFLPQVVLYGVGIVLTGILQAHRRFLGPALAPLLSSLVVVTTYLLYAASGSASLGRLSRGQELLLSVGTTAGVAVLSLGLLVPLRRCGLTLRPTLSFPAGTAARVRGLAAAGVVGLVAQQAALVVALRLAAHGGEGSVVVLQVATSLFLLPWAVLAVPVATTAFPVLAAAAEAGDEVTYTRVARRALTAAVVAMAGATAALIAVAGAVARVLADGVPGSADSGSLQRAVIAFAPGLIGYGLLALLGRALYARGDGRTPAVATVSGWLAVAAADAGLAAGTHMDRAVALGWGNTVGMCLAGALLLRGLHRTSPGALRGLPRTAAAAAASAALGLAVAQLLPGPGRSLPAAALTALGAGVTVGAVFLGGLRLLDRDALACLRDREQAHA